MLYWAFRWWEQLSSAFEKTKDFHSAAEVFIYWYEREGKKEPQAILYILPRLVKSEEYERAKAYCDEFEAWCDTLSPEDRANPRWAHGPEKIKQYRETIAAADAELE